jgi:hypothetical protein
MLSAVIQRFHYKFHCTSNASHKSVQCFARWFKVEMTLIKICSIVAILILVIRLQLCTWTTNLQSTVTCHKSVACAPSSVSTASCDWSCDSVCRASIWVTSWASAMVRYWASQWRSWRRLGLLLSSTDTWGLLHTWETTKLSCRYLSLVSGWCCLWLLGAPQPPSVIQ